MSMQAYRGVGARPAPYDSSQRVRPCDACGAGLAVGDAAETATCPVCGNDQDVPEAQSLDIPASPGDDEPARLQHLRTQLDHMWLIPKSVARFGGNVLEEEIPEARQEWVRLRKALEDDPENEERCIELMCVTFELHTTLPRDTDEQRLARRALAEASAEATRIPELRQKMLYNVAAAATHHDAANGRVWISRMDPYSRSLDADSCYRVCAAQLATSERDFSKVLELLGRDNTSIPIHNSSRIIATALRANALEKLGNLDQAATLLHELFVTRHSSMSIVQRIAQNLPDSWNFCEQSFFEAQKRDSGRLLAQVPHLKLQGMAGFAFGALASFAAAAFLNGIERWAAAAIGAAMLIVVLLRYRVDRQARLELIAGCAPVRGRIVAVRHHQGPFFDLDVVVEREDQPDLPTKTRQYFHAGLQELELDGCSFDALWNPQYPMVFPRITIHVSGDEAKRSQTAKRTEQS